MGKETHNIYTNYDLSFFPIIGENFRHIVWHRLAFGCLVLTTNITPWSRLKEYVIIFKDDSSSVIINSRYVYK